VEFHVRLTRITGLKILSPIAVNSLVDVVVIIKPGRIVAIMTALIKWREK